MPIDSSIRKVMVIGSGPIVIGQAAEFDYAGAQACRVLHDAGVNVVLVNSNPATIMTDKALADEIYLEPLTLTSVKRIIEKEQPDSLLAGLGGQTGLTLEHVGAAIAHRRAGGDGADRNHPAFHLHHRLQVTQCRVHVSVREMPVKGNARTNHVQVGGRIE